MFDIQLQLTLYSFEIMCYGFWCAVFQCVRTQLTVFLSYQAR